MKKKIAFLSVFLISLFVAKSQSLKQLEDLVLVTSIDNADKVVSQWGYEFNKIEKQNEDNNQVFDLVLFSRKSSDIDLNSGIYFAKNKSKPDVPFFTVQFSTQSLTVFNKLKSECESLKNIEKKGESINGKDFVRQYLLGLITYTFVIEASKTDEDLKIYYVYINHK